MQIKKMKDVGQQLLAPQVSDGRGSLTMSPRQPSADRATRPDGQEAQTLLYQGSEAEAAAMPTATCVKCKSVHRVPLRDVRKGPGQSPADDRYVCFPCSLGGAPPGFHFGGGDPGPAQLGNTTEPAPGAAGNKFKVRNFKPGKYYCDKCRFSTKDPLQHKKHTLQHEEIRFICSHCGYVSYTKGEFQRHLVKHTGIFPYQCEYCDYGAIRNDYIVKHRRRVHERAGGKRPPKTAARPEARRAAGAARPGAEPPRACDPGPAPLGRLADQLSRFSLHSDRERARALTRSPEAKGAQRDVVCVPDKAPLLEPSEVSALGNKSVEVEVLSPAREPVQPGMPLTVVAPAELVVPAHCLAQLIDVKVVNGTQQLVLKLFPLEENGCAEAGGADAGRAERLPRDRGPSERDGAASAGRTKALTAVAGSGGHAGAAGPLQPAAHRQLKSVKWVRSYDFFMSNAGVRGSAETLLASDRAEDALRRSHVFPHRAALPPATLKGHPLSSGGKGGGACGLGAASSPCAYKAAVSFAEEGRQLPRDAQRLLPLAAPPAAVSFPGEKGPSPASRSDLESHSELSIPVTVVPAARKLKASQAEDHAAAVSSLGPVSAHRRSEYLHINITGDRMRAPQPGHRPLEVKNAERTGEAFEGPVISSVFSLSSGSEDVPEGVKWNSSTSKIKSIELLRRKIAQLIESCGRPPSSSPAAGGGAHRRPVGPAAKPPPKAAPEGVQEINVAFAGPGYSRGPLPKAQDGGGGGGVSAQRAHQQTHPPFAEGGSGGKADRRGSRKAPVATPVLIPKGAVLRLLNSSKDARVIEATCEAPVSIPRTEAQVIKPAPFSPAKPTDSDLPPPPSERRPADASRNPDAPHRPKPRKESAACGGAPKRAGPPYGQQGSGEPGKHGRLLSRSLSVSKSKTRPGSATKKKSKMPADPARGFKDPSIFQVARQLRLIAAKPDQLIKCPRRNQPVIVLNHPDVDSPEVTNVMKVINKYKGNVLKVVLSERTRCQLGIRRHHVRLTYQNAEEAHHLKRQMMLKMKLKKVHKNNYQVVDASPDDAQCIFKCWFCGRLYEDQEEWMSHGQRHLIEATRDWDVLSSRGK